MNIYKGPNNILTHEYTRQMQFMINDNYTENKHSFHYTNFSYTLDKSLSQSGVGEILIGINSFLTLFEVVFYIIGTYTYPDYGDSSNITINKNINIVEIVLLVFFSMHFILRLYVSQNRFSFLFEFLNLIDYATIICIIISQLSFVNESGQFYMRMFRMIRFIYLLKIENILQKHTNEQMRYMFKLLISLVGIIFISTTIILEMENDTYRQSSGSRGTGANIISTKSVWNLFRFHDILYFEVVTLTTIGFGDITPKSDLARLGTMFTIVIIIAVIPALYSKMNIVFSLTSKYSRVNYAKTKKYNHLIILGDCSPESYEACLEELYHEDHGSIDFDTVIMQTLPNEEMAKMCSSNPCANQIFYLVGDPLAYQDLKRCRANNAICAIILANKLVGDYRQEDFSNIMKAFAIKKYIHMMSSTNIVETRICIQLLLPETKTIYFSSLLDQKEYDNQDQIICVEEIKLQMLGKSCICQGINNIIASLITSGKPSLEDLENIPSFFEWYNEYLDGLGTEIYAITLKAELIFNMTFIDLVKVIYDIFGYVVIGIDVIYEDLKPFVCLNPFTYAISPFDHLIYLLAFNQPNEREINQLLAEHLERWQKGTIEKNGEMVKIKRLKKACWINLGNDGYPKIIGEITNRSEYAHLVQESQIDDPIATPNFSLNINNEFKLRINKIKDHSAANKAPIGQQGFVNTLHPRTQFDSENFSEEILDHHIVICGINTNIKNLIMPLRAKSVKTKNLPILILDKSQHIPSEIWKEIQYFPEIYFMQGNAIKVDDLKKANISRAEAILVLSKKSSDIDQFNMIDADTIFIYKAIKNEVKKSLIIADLNSVSAIGFISPHGNSNIEKTGFWLSEAFASGELYISSMLDTLVCQAFYNPFILNIIQQLLLGDAAFNFPPDITKVLKEKKIIQSTLYLLRIKEQLEKFSIENIPSQLPYETIFNYFSDNNMVSIGIFRNPITLSKSNRKYVYLSPPKDAMINVESDKIYVISYEEEKDEEINSNRQKDNIVSNMKLIEYSNELTNQLLIDLKQVVDDTFCSNKNNLSVKKFVDHTRVCLRSELAQIHKRKEEEIAKEADEEIRNEKIESGEQSSESNKTNKTNQID